MSAPRPSRLMVFFLEVSKAERTPWFCARSNIVGAKTRLPSSMYCSTPAAPSKYEFPTTPCSEGQTTQQIEALLQFVTVGITALAREKTPSAAHRFSVGIALCK